MRRGVRVLLLFLAILTLAVGSGSRALDLWVIAAVWGAFLVLGTIKLWSMRRSPDKSPWTRKLSGGQLAILPRSWRRWVLDEREDRRK